MDVPPEPTLVEVWAPWCHECKVMQPDLDAVAEEWSGKVALQMINAEDGLDTVRSLGVKGTPTLIGYRDGREVFRYTGRRSRSELGQLFASVADGSTPKRVGTNDMVLRVGTGVALTAVGLLTGPSIPLIVIGTVLIAFGLVPRLVRR